MPPLSSTRPYLFVLTELFKFTLHFIWHRKRTHAAGSGFHANFGEILCCTPFCPQCWVRDRMIHPLLLGATFTRRGIHVCARQTRMQAQRRSRAAQLKSPKRRMAVVTDTRATARKPFYTRRPFLATVSVGIAAVMTNEYARYDYKSLSDRGLSTEYNPSELASFWWDHKAVVLTRAYSIGSALLPFIVRQWWAWRQDAGKEETASPEATAARHERHSAAAIELRQILTKLGPTFIKFGQMLSSRPDLLPSVVLTELRKLCDSVPAYSTAEALKLIEQELGHPVVDLFDDLGPGTRPIAAASLGQVYRCRLRETGQTVALKVQRPDMLRSVTRDMFLIRQYFLCVEAAKGFMMRHFPSILAPRKQFDVPLFDAFASASLRELDYLHEGEHQEYFARELGSRMGDAVYVPKVYWQATSNKVLCTEWIDGTPLAKSSPAEIKRLVPVGVECFLVQLLELGFFHADPHAGNLFVENEVSIDSVSGKPRLVLIDFGLVASIET